LVKWPTVLLPKKLGGLGIRDLALHNKCLLMKWLWRYTQEEQSLWKDVIIDKHGALNNWCSNVSTEPYGVGVWRSISKLWEEFSQHKHLIAGNGQNINFWRDKWIGNSSLMVAYPNIFHIVREPNFTIQQYIKGNSWNIILRRNIQYWEMEELVSLLAALHSVAINSETPDQLNWGEKKGWEVMDRQLLINGCLS